MTAGSLRAVSDLHVTHKGNRELIDRVRPQHEDDWLIVAGDIAVSMTDIERVLRTLRDRFATVIWTPGNHELWTMPADPEQACGVARYERLIALARRLGVITPEDPYPVWDGPGGPVRIAPLCLLYDYSWLAPGTSTQAASLAAARQAGVVCVDEKFLHPDPYPSRAAWCAAQVATAERRLSDAGRDIPLVLVNHWPLVREPTKVMIYQELVQWCGTNRTADWHLRFPVAAVVYGHLHIPRSTVYDDVPFEEVSIGYPREWRRFGLRDELARRILPRP